VTYAISIDGVSRTAVIPRESWEFVEAADKGEVGHGGFDLHDLASAITVPAHKLVIATEGTATPQRIHTGYVGEQGRGRHDFAQQGTDRAWDVHVTDQNTILSDRIIRTADGNRGSETDYARIQWLLGSGYLDAAEGFVPNTNTVTMDAADYRGKTARDVLDECAEHSGKNFFVFYDETDTRRELFYDLATGTNFSSAKKISSAGDAEGSTIFAPDWEGEDGLTSDPSAVYSGVWLEGDGVQVFRENATTLANYRRREIPVSDGEARTTAAATQEADQFLAQAATPAETITCSIHVPAAMVNDVLAGHRIEVKFPHLGIAAFAWWRVVRRAVRVDRGGPGDRFRLRLELANPKITRFGGRPRRPGTPPAEAELEATDLSYVVNGLNREVPGDGPIVYALDTDSIGSWVYDNHPYTGAGCPVGGGLWNGQKISQRHYTVTLPADDGEIVGFRWTPPGGFDPQGYVDGILYKLSQGAHAATAGHFDAGGSAFDGFVPRTGLTFGASACFVCYPAWEAGGEFCNLAANFDFPVDDGRGASGKWNEPADDEAVIETIRFAAGARGSSGWVGGIGDVDGSNREFELVRWDGTGNPRAQIGPVEELGLVYDRTARTVTLPVAPVTGSIVTFDYQVGA
jgi:hypothetical protein